MRRGAARARSRAECAHTPITSCWSWTKVVWTVLRPGRCGERREDKGERDTHNGAQRRQRMPAWTGLGSVLTWQEGLPRVDAAWGRRRTPRHGRMLLTGLRRCAALPRNTPQVGRHVHAFGAGMDVAMAAGVPATAIPHGARQRSRMDLCQPRRGARVARAAGIAAPTHLGSRINAVLHASGERRWTYTSTPKMAAVAQAARQPWRRECGRAFAP